MQDVGKWMMVAGGLILLLGALLFFVGRFFEFGRLPGDIVWKRDNVVIYIPITTMLLLSVLLTIVLNLILRLFGGGGE